MKTPATCPLCHAHGLVIRPGLAGLLVLCTANACDRQAILDALGVVA